MEKVIKVKLVIFADSSNKKKSNRFYNNKQVISFHLHKYLVKNLNNSSLSANSSIKNYRICILVSLDGSVQHVKAFMCFHLCGDRLNETISSTLPTNYTVHWPD